MYFKNLKSNLESEKRESEKFNTINYLLKKRRDRNSVYFSVDTAGRGKEIEKMFLGA